MYTTDAPAQYSVSFYVESSSAGMVLLNLIICNAVDKVLTWNIH